MSKIEITRTELVWPGKYDEEGNLVTPRRVNLPFQVIERVNETRGTRDEREKKRAGHVATLFDYWQADEESKADPGDGWRNKLIWGDNLYVMSSLLEHFAGKVDLIYIDPPFATGADFRFTTHIGDNNLELIKEQSIIEEKAYRDTWRRGLDSYLQMMYERLALMRNLLSDSGSIFVHVDRRVNSQIRLIMEALFGKDQLVNEIIWCYGGGGAPRNYYPQKHDTLFWYAKGDTWTFNKQFRPYTKGTLQRGLTKVKGEKYKLDERGAGLDDWWADKDVQKILSPTAYENLKYPTQKPEGLLARVLQGHSHEGDLVADFFCGSGTTLAVAEKLGRRWIGCDLSRYAIHTTRKRLMDIPDCRPFEILNLGKYERQVWQGVTFGRKKRPQQMLVFEYLKFILELYGSQPLAGTQHLHGKKGSVMVHVGAVDAPVTIDEINACIEECVTMKQKELHILGWEWEMGIANLMVDQAKARGIKLLLLAIPREVMEQQAVDKGDIHFYELAYLEVEIKPSKKKRSYRVHLTDFVIPNNELIPPDVRSKIKKWSDYVDYWAVDWDFRDDSFVNAWTSYRTRRQRTLDLVSDPHVYDATGVYRILVKVIDIFGNDTSQSFELEVK